MIQRYQTSSGKKIGILAGHVLVHALVLGFIALMVSTSHLWGMIFFAAMLLGFACFSGSLFIRGKIHEVYLLSDRTLAVLHPRRPTRYLKPRHLSQFRPESNTFVEGDGTKFQFSLPNDIRELSENLITRWFGETQLAACRAAASTAHRLPKSFWIPYVLLAVGTLITATHFGFTENWLLANVSVAAFAVEVVVYIAWITIAAQRVVCSLVPCSDGDVMADADYGMPKAIPSKFPIRRFPLRRQKTGAYLGSYIGLLLLPVIFLLILGVAVIKIFPPETRVATIVTLTLIVTTPIGAYLGLQWYKALIRGDLFTTVFLSRRTLAILRAKQPTRYIKREDCVAYQPGIQRGSGRLVLRDGTRIRFGFAETTSDSSGPTLTIWRRWWPYVPEKKRIVTPVRGIIACYTGVVGAMLLLFGADRESDALLLPGLGLLLGVVAYFLARLFRIPYTFSLRPEDYPDAAAPMTQEKIRQE